MEKIMKKCNTNIATKTINPKNILRELKHIEHIDVPEDKRDVKIIYKNKNIVIVDEQLLSEAKLLGRSTISGRLNRAEKYVNEKLNEVQVLSDELVNIVNPDIKKEIENRIEKFGQGIKDRLKIIEKHRPMLEALGTRANGMTRYQQFSLTLTGTHDLTKDKVYQGHLERISIKFLKKMKNSNIDFLAVAGHYDQKATAHVEGIFELKNGMTLQDYLQDLYGLEPIDKIKHSREEIKLLGGTALRMFQDDFKEFVMQDNDMLLYLENKDHEMIDTFREHNTGKNIPNEDLKKLTKDRDFKIRYIASQAEKYKDSETVPKSVFDSLVSSLNKSVKRLFKLEKYEKEYKSMESMKNGIKEMRKILIDKEKELYQKASEVQNNSSEVSKENSRLTIENKKLKSESYIKDETIKSLTMDRDKWYELSQELDRNGIEY